MSEIDAELNRLTHAVIGAAIAVHRTLGPGFLEKMYEEALCIEMDERGIPYARQVNVVAMYRGKKIGTGTLDLLVGDRLIIELKAVEELAAVHEAQALAYLRITGKRPALLINFSVPVLRDVIKRVAR